MESSHLGGRDVAGVTDHGFEDHRGDVASLDQLFHVGQVPVGSHQSVLGGALWDTFPLPIWLGENGCTRESTERRHDQTCTRLRGSPIATVGTENHEHLVNDWQVVQHSPSMGSQ